MGGGSNCLPRRLSPTGYFPTAVAIGLPQRLSPSGYSRRLSPPGYGKISNRTPEQPTPPTDRVGRRWHKHLPFGRPPWFTLGLLPAVRRFLFSAMHVCLVATEYLPGPGGGVATYTSILARLLVDAGHRVTVLVKQANDDLPRFEEEGGLRVRRVPLLNPASGKSIWEEPDLFANEMIHLRTYVGVFAREVSRLLPEIHAEDPLDLILSQDVEAPTYLFQSERFLFNRMAEVPVVVFIHSPHRQIQYFNEESIYDRAEYHRVYYEEQSMALADGLIAASDYMKRDMMDRMGFPDEAIRVIPLPLGEVPAEAAPLAGETGRRLVYAGRLEPRKGVEVLVRAFAALAPAEPDLHLDLIGADRDHGPSGKSFSDFLGKFLPESVRGRVHFHGPMPRAEIWARYRAADLGVVPSLWEPFSFACQEMMATGLPVVATTEGGMAEMIEDGVSGFLCPAFDPQALADRIREALGKSGEELTAMGERARARIGRFCENRAVVGDTADYFEEVIERTKREFRERGRFPVPANLPFGNRALAAPHPAAAFGSPARVEKVAAVVTCYNLGEYLEECVGSLLRQEEVVPHVIVVNDGSTDPATLGILDSFRDRAEVEVLDFPNGGLPVARRRGAEAAWRNGFEALLFVDADDWIESDYLRKAREVLDRHPEAGAVNAWTHTIGLMHTYWIPHHSQFPQLLAECLSTPPALVRREAYEAAGGVSPRLKYSYEDWDFWVAICRAGYALLTIPEPLTRYRMRTGSMSQEYRWVTREHGRREMLDRHRDLIGEYGREALLLVEGYWYRDQSKPPEVRVVEKEVRVEVPVPPPPPVPWDKKIYRFFRDRVFRRRKRR